MLADGSEYRGRYGLTVAQLRDFHRDRLRVLAGTDADVLAVETIPEVEEAAAVAELLAETPGAAAWVSFSCADGQRIRSGAPIEEAVAAVATTPAVARGRHQLHGPRARAGAHRADRRRDRACPSSCTPTAARRGTRRAAAWTGDAGTGVDGDAARAWVARGARLVGGCCRVTPDQIASIAGAVAPQ